MPPKAFSFTHFPKNTSANRLESHTFKTKDLKPFRFIHFQKSGGGGVVWVCLFAIQHLTSNLRPSLNPVASTLTRKLHLKPFRINTYKKQGEGGGVRAIGARGDNEGGAAEFRISHFEFRLSARPLAISAMLVRVNRDE